MKNTLSIYGFLLTALAFAESGCSKQNSSQAQVQVQAPVATAEVGAQTGASDSIEMSSARSEGATLVRIATIEGVEKNAEFQRNLNIVNKQKQLVIALNRKLEESTDPAEREELQDALDKAAAKLSENNQKMIDTYGFTLARNYSLVIEKSQIFMSVTEEEAERVANK